jgi:hypothetical protein
MYNLAYLALLCVSPTSINLALSCLAFHHEKYTLRVKVRRERGTKRKSHPLLKLGMATTAGLSGCEIFLQGGESGAQRSLTQRGGNLTATVCWKLTKCCYPSWDQKASTLQQRQTYNDNLVFLMQINNSNDLPLRNRFVLNSVNEAKKPCIGGEGQFDNFLEDQWNPGVLIGLTPVRHATYSQLKEVP